MDMSEKAVDRLKALTFQRFLRILDEDLEGDVSKIRADISALDAAILQRTQTLQVQKARLTKMLSVKEKQLQSQTKRDAAKPDGEQQGSQASAPGQTGASTPGQ